MATGLAAQAAAAVDGTFVAKVEAAIVAAAVAVYNEATMLAGNLAAGLTVTSVPISFALGSTIAGGTMVSIGGEVAMVAPGGASSGSTSIPVNPFTPARSHTAGEPVSPPTVSAHVARAAYARAVLQNPTGNAVLFAWALAAQGVDVLSTDSAIEGMVSAVWNPLAGA